MKTESNPLHGSYFDLAAAKHPDLQTPESSQQQEGQPARRRRRFVVLPAVLCGALVGVAWLVIVLRPEEHVRLVASTAPVPVSVALETARSEDVEAKPVARLPGSSQVVLEEAATIERPTSSPEIPTSVVPVPFAEDDLVEEQVSAEESEQREPDAPESSAVEAVSQDSPIIAESAEISIAPPAAVLEPPDIVRESPIVDGPTAADAEPLAVAEFLSARKIFSPPPAYPDAARLAGEEGTVVVEANIDASGAVTDAVVVRGRSPALDAAAIAALESWRFDPATRGGTAIASSYRVGFTFAFNEETEAPAPDEASEPEPTGPFEVGGDVTAPRRLVAPLPSYPDAAWAQGVAGDVLVRAVIDENGDVTEVEVLRGLPYGLTEAAVEAIKRWKFAPSTRHGKPVAVYRNLNLRFEG